MRNTVTTFLFLLLFAFVTFAQETKQEVKSSVNSTNGVTATTYDFTTGSDKYYGGTNGAVEVEANVWGMIAGDTDGSGVVDATDRSNTWNERNLTGYRASDVSLSGVTDAGDRSITWNNRNKVSAVPTVP